MKKTLLLASIAASIFVADAKAFAIEADPYVGFDYSSARYTYGSKYNGMFKKDYNAFDFVGGIKTDYYFGLEAFLQRSNRETQYSSFGKFTTNHVAFGADLLGYLPIYEDLDLIGGVGLGSYYFRARNATASNSNKHTYGTRFTLGAQYNLDENWGIRTTYRYIQTSQSDFFKRGSEYSVGIRYTFK
ncbi:MAG: outer membrane beta-barrel protein [Alphaproteobacteria bacterium]